MHWTIDANPDPLDLAPEDLTIRPGILPAEHPLAAARGCMYGLMFAGAFWALLFGWLFFAGFLLASIPTP
jgi:hypothetical protein